MRKENLVAVGQGCRQMACMWSYARKQIEHRCEKHHWLFLNICLGCGEKFHSEMPHSKTCSGKCRVRLFRMRHGTLVQSGMELTT